jgi:hypothetical protein
MILLDPPRKVANASGKERYSQVMRRALALVVASLAVAAGSSGAHAAVQSGIRGTVIKSPTKPVCDEGVPCTAPASGVTLVFVRDGVRVATATTSKAGTYRVVLRPGTYVVRTLRKLPFGSPQPRTVRVLPMRFVVVNFEIDTGIR